MTLCNYTEIAVENVIKELFDSYKDVKDYCNCQICRSRAAAIALNDLEPQYVTSDAEFMAAVAKYQNPANSATLVAIVMDAIRQVLANQNHNMPPLTLHHRNQYRSQSLSM